MIYDNFDFQKSVKHQLINNHEVIRLVITNKFIYDTDILFKELKQIMFHEHVSL